MSELWHHRVIILDELLAESLSRKEASAGLFGAEWRLCRRAGSEKGIDSARRWASVRIAEVDQETGRTILRSKSRGERPRGRESGREQVGGPMPLVAWGAAARRLGILASVIP